MTWASSFAPRLTASFKARRQGSVKSMAAMIRWNVFMVFFRVVIYMSNRLASGAPRAACAVVSLPCHEGAGHISVEATTEESAPRALVDREAKDRLTSPNVATELRGIKIAAITGLRAPESPSPTATTL